MPHIPLESVNLNLLVALDALLQECNVSAASRRLGLTQSATSHALARLRILLDDDLLVRSPNGMQPTPRAQRLAPRLALCLQEVSGLLNDCQHFDPKSANMRFVVGTADYLSGLLAAPVARSLVEQSAKVGVRFSGPVADPMSESLRNGGVDVAIGPTRKVAGDIEHCNFVSDRHMCALRNGHPALEANKLTLSRYCKLSHIVVSPTGRGTPIVDDALAAKNRTRTISILVESFMVAPVIVSDSDLVLTAPRMLLSRVAKRFGLTLVEPPLKLPETRLEMFWEKRLTQDSAHRWLRSLLLDARPS